MLLSIDFYILNIIQNLRCSALDFIMPKITALGNGGAIWLIVAAAMCFFKSSRKTGMIMLIGLAIGVICGNLILKPLVSRPRPCWINSGIELLIENPTDYSFPSGHTLSSFIAAFVLALSGSRLSGSAIVLASLIAFSRLYLYVHFPSDILGAIIIAAAIASAAMLCGGALIERVRLSKMCK